jgi:hypothetical protein
MYCDQPIRDSIPEHCERVKVERRRVTQEDRVVTRSLESIRNEAEAQQTLGALRRPPQAKRKVANITRLIRWFGREHDDVEIPAFSRGLRHSSDGGIHSA